MEVKVLCLSSIMARCKESDEDLGEWFGGDGVDKAFLDFKIWWQVELRKKERKRDMGSGYGGKVGSLDGCQSSVHIAAPPRPISFPPLFNMGKIG
ncbi:hypothetical protein L1887_09483 [Cichorium endivia]|nr:hypothetical protein L1887_09483 [Cichorium endivia]